MIRVGWLADRPAYVGGAELTQEEFRAAVPREVETVDCLPGRVDPDCDVYAIHNCLSYSLKDLKRTQDKRTVKYWNDAGNWYPREMREWFDGHAAQVCCSNLQARHMRLSGAHLIPPPVNLTPFEQAAISVNGNRRGTVSVAQWRASNKGADAILEWARQRGEHVDFYGGGACKPPNSREVAYRGMPMLLARYERFVFLPLVLEPFGRLVAEAWASGAQVITNRRVGAIEWLTDNPDAIRTAGENYWQLLLRQA